MGFLFLALVVELVDTPDLGSGVRKDVRVRVSPRVHISRYGETGRHARLKIL